MAKVLIGYSCCPKTRDAFDAAGHTAITCDLLPSRGAGRHLQMDVWEAIALGGWDFAVLHPMCTYLTVSAAWAYKDPDFERYPGVGYHQRPAAGTLTGAARREAQAEAIANFQRLMDLPFPAVIENPAMSYVSRAVGSPNQIIHPYHFGDDASKATGLWHNHAARAAGLPQLDHGQYVEPRMVRQPSGKFLPRWGNQTDSGQNKLGPSDPARWLIRSETYAGIAAALGKQYGEWLTRMAPAGRWWEGGGQ